MCNAAVLALHASSLIYFAQTGVYLAQYAYSRRKRSLSAFSVFKGVLEVEVHCLDLSSAHSLHSIGGKHDDRDARRTRQGFLRTGDHHVHSQLFHVEWVSKERADAVYHEEDAVAMTEIADELYVVEHAGGSLVKVDKQSRIVLSLIWRKMLSG